VLLLDEPSAGLDPASRRHVIELLTGLPQTKLVASHDLDLIAETCERVLLLSEGRLVRDASARDVFQDRELLSSCRLEQPLSMQRCAVCSRDLR
jgi:cobalt/nickel transport system ATP-binding protein